MTHADLIATVGRTPLVELRRLAKDLPGRVLAKLEMRNPSGNVKDRVAVALVQDAESRGLLKPGMTIVEATGGNTGIGLAFVCAVRGYSLILTMPETLSVERVALLRQLGAEVVCPNHRRGARQRCHPFWRPGGELPDSRNRRREDHRGDSSRHGRKVYHHEL